MSQAQQILLAQASTAANAASPGFTNNIQAQTGVKKNNTKAKPKTLKRVLPSGAGFQMFRDAAGEEMKILDDVDEGVAFKKALRAVSPNLDKTVVDAAIAKLFHDAAEMAPRRAATQSIPDTLLAAARKAGWVTAARKDMEPAVAAKVMMRFYEARRVAVKFSTYRQHPISYDEETATARAIDALRNEKPNERPEELFADWTRDMLDDLMGKILRRENTSWDGKGDEDGDAHMIGGEEATDFAASQKAARAEMGEALAQKLKELGLHEDAARFLN